MTSLKNLFFLIERYYGKPIAAGILGFGLGVYFWEHTQKENYLSQITQLKNQLAEKNTALNEFKEQLKISNKEHVDSAYIDIQSLKIEVEQCQADKHKLLEYNSRWEKSYEELRLTAQSCTQSNADLQNNTNWLREREKALRIQIANDEQKIAFQRRDYGEAKALCDQYQRSENMMGGATAEQCIEASKLKEILLVMDKSFESKQNELAMVQKSLFDAGEKAR